MIINGLYRKNLHLEDYETVVLVAKGIKIVGILPYVYYIIYQRVNKDKEFEAYYRGLITRKINVFWVLDNNYEDT